MSRKISHQGVARVAKYVEISADGGENRTSAMKRGRRLEETGRLTEAGVVVPIHPDEQNTSTS